MSTHADHYMTNFAYGRAAYSKGATFLGQLTYIVGEDVFYPAMRTYFNEWKFKHPNDNDFIRVMEKASDLELDWYREYWVNSTKQIDYGFQSVLEKDGKTFVTLEKIGEMPMPLEVTVTYNDGNKELIYIPLRIMRGGKPFSAEANAKVLADWPWVFPTYTFELNQPAANISSMVIDENEGMADVDRENNVFDTEKHLKATFDN
jgi:aminopeptidase N